MKAFGLFVSNAAINYSSTNAVGKGVGLFVNNLFNTEYVANGYASTSFVKTRTITLPTLGLYPQATRIYGKNND